jgi:hypothetical protein
MSKKYYTVFKTVRQSTFILAGQVVVVSYYVLFHPQWLPFILALTYAGRGLIINSHFLLWFGRLFVFCILLWFVLSWYIVNKIYTKTNWMITIFWKFLQKINHYIFLTVIQEKTSVNSVTWYRHVEISIHYIFQVSQPCSQENNGCMLLLFFFK